MLVMSIWKGFQGRHGQAWREARSPHRRPAPCVRRPLKSAALPRAIMPLPPCTDLVQATSSCLLNSSNQCFQHILSSVCCRTMQRGRKSGAGRCSFLLAAPCTCRPLPQQRHPTCSPCSCQIRMCVVFDRPRLTKACCTASRSAPGGLKAATCAAADGCTPSHESHSPTHACPISLPSWNATQLQFLSTNPHHKVC